MTEIDVAAEEVARARKFPWYVRGINRETKKMFDRRLIFDPGLCSSGEEMARIEPLLEDRSKHRQLIEFRHLFREHDEESFRRELLSSNGFGGINLQDYFEDESGHALDEVDLISIVTGEANPVIMGNVTSVFRLGPSEMLDPALWSVQESNDVQHFIQVVKLLQTGRWWNSRPKLTWTGNGPYSLRIGDVESFAAAFPLVRQFLLTRDDVFTRIASLYLKHVDSVQKRDWVTFEIKRFTESLASDWRFMPVKELKGISNSDLIDAVVYGTGLIHRKSNQQMEEKLLQLSQLCSREQLMFAFDAACRHVLEAPFNIAPLIYHEFAQWVQAGACPKPTRVVLRWLFQSTESEDQ